MRARAEIRWVKNPDGGGYWTWRVVGKRGKVLAEPIDPARDHYIGPWGKDFATERASRELAAVQWKQPF